MAEQTDKKLTINFAGREIDAHDFVNLALSKAEDWMNYQRLLGDERNDFSLALREVLLGIVDGKTYSVSEFGKILGLPENNSNYYRTKDGAKKDGPGEWYNSRRVGFNPYLNVETFLNGVARLTPEYREPKKLGGKKWSKSTMGSLIGSAIYGEGNSYDPRLKGNSAQLEAWANSLDKYENGTRETTKRKEFINDILTKYQTALNNGEYDISDEDKKAELENLNTLLKPDVKDWELGKISPLLTHYLFTGEKYMTDQEKQLALQQAQFNTWLTNPDPRAAAPDFLQNPENYYLQRLSNIMSARNNEFDAFNQEGLYANKGVNLEGYQPFYEYNQKPVYFDYNQDVKNALLDVPINKLVKTANSNQLYTYFTNLGSEEIKGKFYYPDWENGDLYVWTKGADGHSINLSIVGLSKTIAESKTKNKDLYKYLRTSWDTYKGYDDVSQYKEGGILKAYLGTSLHDKEKNKINTTPKLESEATVKTTDETPKDVTTNVTETKTTTEPTKTTSNETPKTDVNTEIGGWYHTGRLPETWLGKDKSSRMIDAIGWRKALSNLYHNFRSFNYLTSLAPVYLSPLRKEYLMHSPKALEDLISDIKSGYNLLGTNAAAGTADQGSGFAYQLNARKLANSDIKQFGQAIATHNATLADKALENENNNALVNKEVADKNHAASVAMYNYNKQQNAEFESRLGRDAQIIETEKLRGIALSAQENALREMQIALYNDPKYKEAYDGYYSLSNQYLDKQAELNKETDPNKIEELTRKRDELAQEMNIRKNQMYLILKRFNDTYYTQRAPIYSYPWALPGLITEPSYPNPFPEYARGGKMEYAEREKTKRMYAKMLFDMMKMDMNHMYKANRDAYKDYRKIFMQQSK